MSHNPLSLSTLGFLAPTGSGESVNVPVTSLSVGITDAAITAAIEHGELKASVKDRTPINAIAENKNLLIKVDNG